MAPSRSLPSTSARNVEVIDLVSEDENEEAHPSLSYAHVVAGTKRSRDSTAATNDSHPEEDSKHEHQRLKREQESPSHLSTCMPFINADVPDNAIVTDAIMPLLHRLNLSGVLTCAGRKHASFTMTHSSLLHIQQTDKWSCGFRNLQILFTALLPQVPSQHAFYQTVPASLGHYPLQDNRPIPVPSLHQLQTFLEDSWKDGFDERGAQHYNHRIVGKRSQIGAIEVSTILSYLHLDSTVVQFIKCRESRAMLGPFVWNYFLQGPCFSCSNADGSISCSSWAERLLEAAASRTENTKETKNDTCCSCPILSLYLQWEGHSATIVGVEKTKNNDISFLMFDPLKNGSTLKQALQSNRKDTLAQMHLSSKTLLKKDVQVVMCSPRALVEKERHAIRKFKGNVVTAAEDAVARFCQRT